MNIYNANIDDIDWINDNNDEFGEEVDLDYGNNVFVCKDDYNNIIGYIYYTYYDDDIIIINQLRSFYKRMGIASLLIQTIKDIYPKHFIILMVLGDLDTEKANSEAMSFYNVVNFHSPNDYEVQFIPESMRYFMDRVLIYSPYY